jgi:O-antigen ligase
MLLVSAMLTSVGGLFEWPILPCLALAALLFFLSGARVGADKATLAVDVVVLLALTDIALQMAPMPGMLLRVISPATARLQDTYAIAPFTGWRPLSIQPSSTRTSLALALSAALIFWSAREAFSRGGTRAAIRVLAAVGCVCAIVSLAQRATAPKTVLWNWRVDDPRALPFGPFVDRNQLATWLVLAIVAVGGYVVMHVRVHMHERVRRDGRAALLALSDAAAVSVVGCMAAMLITLAATLSRSGLIALVAAVAIGSSLWSGNRARGLGIGAIAAAVLVLLAAWLNVQGLADRVVATLTSSDPNNVGRLVIWRDTLGIVRDFPLFGTGAGTFEGAMFVYQKTAREVLFNHAHNEYLQLLTEGGAVLLSLVVVGILLFARAARRRLVEDRGAHRLMRIAACAALGGIALQSVWETGLRAPANLLLAAILAALAVHPVDHAPGMTTDAEFRAS